MGRLFLLEIPWFVVVSIDSLSKKNCIPNSRKLTGVVITSVSIEEPERSGTGAEH